ncbi:Suppressor of G2 allele of SKP1 like protein [Chelonia mydas]|uniref:Suppressor of G2 allele of SKP1 like protein n=1 Tax=Chelonia mydas TaxID=8469 RepID=M7C1T1_CHEMY|nr:Suppressor of G2 allele of SKP1 like protein [Chelonia mydas]
MRSGSVNHILDFVSSKKLTVALEQKPDDAEYYCQRAYAHILLQNYWDAVADAKKSLELNPSNATAFLRKGISEYHSKNYASALESFKEGQKLDTVLTQKGVVGWSQGYCRWDCGIATLTSALLLVVALSSELGICRAAAAGWEPSSEGRAAASSNAEKDHRLKWYDWYQTESQVIVTLMIKNAQKDDISVQFSEKELNALVRLPSGEDYNLKLVLLHSIVPEQSTFKVLSTKGKRMGIPDSSTLDGMEEGARYSWCGEWGKEEVLWIGGGGSKQEAPGNSSKAEGRSSTGQWWEGQLNCLAIDSLLGGCRPGNLGELIAGLLGRPGSKPPPAGSNGLLSLQAVDKAGGCQTTL